MKKGGESWKQRVLEDAEDWNFATNQAHEMNLPLSKGQTMDAMGSGIQDDFAKLGIDASPLLDTQWLAKRFRRMGLFDSRIKVPAKRTCTRAFAQLLGSEDFKSGNIGAFNEAYGYKPPSSRWARENRTIFVIYSSIFKIRSDDPILKAKRLRI